MNNNFSDEQIKGLFITRNKENIQVSEQFHTRVLDTLSTLPNKKPRKKFIIPSIIAAALVISCTVAFADNIPLVSDVMNFFKSNKFFTASKDAETYGKYAKDVGKTVTNNGVSITIDNIACDDNFFVIFYTAQGEGEKITKGKMVPTMQRVGGTFKVNGKDVISKEGYGDAYLTEDGKIKGVLKADISKESLPNEFDVNFNAFTALNTQGEWNFDFKASKAETKKETKIVDVNKEFKIKFKDHENNIKIEKVSLSPLGNSIVISETFSKQKDAKTQMRNAFNRFALFNDKGDSLDSSSLSGYTCSSNGARNSFEFIKGNKTIKYIKLVPVAPHYNIPVKDTKDPVSPLINFPLQMKVSNRASVVVEKIDFTDAATKIYYTRKGYISQWGDRVTDFYFVDANGKHIFDDVNVDQWDYILDRDKGSYVKILPPLDKSKTYKLGCHKDGNYEYLEDQSIIIPIN